MRACICQTLLHGDLERPRNRLCREATSHCVVTHRPQALHTIQALSVSESSTDSGERVKRTGFGWGCNTSLLPCLSLV